MRCRPAPTEDIALEAQHLRPNCACSSSRLRVRFPNGPRFVGVGPQPRPAATCAGRLQCSRRCYICARVRNGSDRSRRSLAGYPACKRNRIGLFARRPARPADQLRSDDREVPFSPGPSMPHVSKPARSSGRGSPTASAQPLYTSSWKCRLSVFGDAQAGHRQNSPVEIEQRVSRRAKRYHSCASSTAGRYRCVDRLLRRAICPSVTLQAHALSFAGQTRRSTRIPQRLPEKHPAPGAAGSSGCRR